MLEHWHTDDGAGAGELGERVVAIFRQKVASVLQPLGIPQARDDSGDAIMDDRLLRRILHIGSRRIVHGDAPQLLALEK
jgi:hypothetical protein